MAWLWFAGLNGGLGASAYLTSRFGFHQPRGATRVLGAVVVGWSWLTFGMELLGALGLLGRAGLLGWVTLGLVVSLAIRSRRPWSDTEHADSERWNWSEVISVGLVLAASSLFLGNGLLAPVKVVSDGPIYHLYFAARWWKAGSLDLIASPFGENAATYFPANGDLWFTWLLIGWGGERFAKIGQVPFLALSGVAAFALARRLGARRDSSIVAACWFLSVAYLLTYAFEPNVDQIFIAAYLIAAYFFLRFALGDDGRASLILGGLAAGLALGTKAPAVVFVPPLVVLGMLAAWRGGCSRKQGALGVVIVAVAVFATSGYWYARNFLLTGNPLYPLHLEAFGRVWLRGWYGREAMHFSLYYSPIDDWKRFVDIALAVVDPRLAVFWLLPLLGAWRWGSTAKSPLDRWVWLASGLAVANVVLFWVFIPYRTQQRFMLHALGLAVVPLARLIDRAAWLRWGAVALMAVHFLTPQAWPVSETEPPWDLAPEVPNAVPALIAFPHTWAQWRLACTSSRGALGLAVIVGVLVVSTESARAWFASTSRRRRLWAVAMTAAYVVTALALAYSWRSDARSRFFPFFPDYIRGWRALDERCGAQGARIAYAGTDLPFYLLGPGFRNDVRYVNIDAHRDWLLHDYHREALRTGNGPATWPRPRPGWDRIHPDYDAWLANLRAERIQLLVVTKADPNEGRHNIADSASFTIERTWADAHPEVFQVVYGESERDPRFRLYRVKPPAPAH